MTSLTITAKGQVTLKKEVLRHLGVKPGDTVDVDLLPGGRIQVAATPLQQEKLPIDAFFACIDNTHDVHASLEEIEEAIQAGWAGERN